MYGKFILGTYGLDADGNRVPVWVDSSEGLKFSTFATIFDPIEYQLPIADKKRLCLFFCLSYSEQAKAAAHIFAKSMIYAYQELVRPANTNFLEYGSVYFWVDQRLADIVAPYCRAAGLESLIKYFSSDIDKNYAAYIPLFWHKDHQKFPYRFYMDADMWWQNLGNQAPFDWGALLSELDASEANVFGYRTPDGIGKPEEVLQRRLYLRDDIPREAVKEFMNTKFGADIPPANFHLRGILNGIRASKETVKLYYYVKRHANLFRDDETMWLVMLEDTGIQVQTLEGLIPETHLLISIEAAEQQSPSLIHTGKHDFQFFEVNPHTFCLPFYDEVHKPVGGV